MTKVIAYFKHEEIEQYESKRDLDFLIRFYKVRFETPGFPMGFNENKYISNELNKIVFIENNLKVTLERNDNCE